MIKTYEGFLDVFKKKQDINDIYNALEVKIKSKDVNINININRNPNFLSYENILYKSASSGVMVYPYVGKDIFMIKLKNNKRKINCEIEINRELNFAINREYFPKMSENFEINATDKIEIIVKEILSEVNALNLRFKTEEDYKTNYILTLHQNELENRNKEREEFHKKVKEFHKKVEDWVNSKFKELDMDNVRDMIDSYLRDDFEDIEFHYYESSGSLYVTISGTQILPDKSRIEHLKKKLVCNEFLERFLSEYGEECEVKSQFEGDNFKLQIKVAELPKVFLNKYEKY